MEEKDIPAVRVLWHKFMAHFDMVPDVTEEDVRHYLLSGRGEGETKDRRRQGQVVWSYVVEVNFIPISGTSHKLKTLFIGSGHSPDHRLFLFLHPPVLCNQQRKAPHPRRCLPILLWNRGSLAAERTIEWCPEAAIVSTHRRRSRYRITSTLIPVRHDSFFRTHTVE